MLQPPCRQLRITRFTANDGERWACYIFVCRFQKCFSWFFFYISLWTIKGVSKISLICTAAYITYSELSIENSYFADNLLLVQSHIVLQAICRLQNLCVENFLKKTKVKDDWDLFLFTYFPRPRDVQRDSVVQKMHQKLLFASRQARTERLVVDA